MRRFPWWLVVLGQLPLAAAASGVPDGRALFHGHVAYAAGREATANRLPPGLDACAACHGALAEGGREGGVVAPPISWSALIASRAGQPAYGDAAAVRRALSEGVGRGGRTLDPTMPRYRLKEAEAASLIAFLQRAGTPADLPPGVVPDSITLGTVLPLSGDAASSGRAVLAGLHDVFDGIGVHGRSIALAAEDSAAGNTVPAVQRLLARPVHALVAAMPGRAAPEAAAMLAKARVPQVAGLVARARPEDIGPWELDLLPPISLQREVLEQAMHRCSGPGLALEIDPAASEATPGRVVWFRQASAFTALADGSAPGCVGFSLAHLARMAAIVPPSWQRRVVLPMPQSLLAPDADGNAPGLWRQLGRAAARLTVELLAQSGAALHERSMLAQAPALQGYAPLPGVVVQFGRNRRHAWDAEVLELDQPDTGTHDASRRQTP